MVDLGVVFRPQFPATGLRAAARAADDSGVDEFWLWEDCFDHGGVATAAAALAFTERVRVGIGVLPVPLRNAALTAMEIAALAGMFPGRIEAGVGHGVQEWMRQVGAGVASPMTLLREHIGAIRALLAGESVTVEGRYVSLDAVRLAWPPASPPPRLHVAAVGPKTVALAAEAGDGLVLTGETGLEQLRAQKAIYDEHNGGTGHVTVYLVCITGDGADQRLRAERASWGLDEDAEVGVGGDARAVADAVLQLAEAGADSVVLQPTADEDPVAFARFAGGDVRPLLV